MDTCQNYRNLLIPYSYQRPTHSRPLMISLPTLPLSVTRLGAQGYLRREIPSNRPRFTSKRTKSPPNLHSPPLTGRSHSQQDPDIPTPTRRTSLGVQRSVVFLKISRRDEHLTASAPNSGRAYAMAAYTEVVGVDGWK